MKKIEINNYKCLGNLSISDLQRVNLFTGKNNTGKSTILEAISLFAVKGNLTWIRRLLDSRGEINNYRDETASIENNLEIFSSFFNERRIGFSEENALSINTDKERFSMRFVKFIEEEVVEKDAEGNEFIFTKRRILPGNAEDDKLSYGLELKVGNNSQMFHLNRNMFRRTPFNFESGNFHLINATGDDINNSANLWDKITLSEKEDLVIEALKIIEPRINRLSFIGENNNFRNTRYPIVKLSNSKSIYPLKAMGDGINRILNLTLALVNSDNGYLLIDECENGLHYSVQEELWEIIFEIANKLNIQVFATTHSNDSINSFARVLERNNKFEGSLFRLERRDESILAKAFTRDEITEAANQKINLR